jgi:hypothetical protein
VDVSTDPLMSFDKPEDYLERQVNRSAPLWEVATLRTSSEVAGCAGRPEATPPHDPGRIRPPRRPPTRSGWLGVMAIRVQFLPRVEWTRVDNSAQPYSAL